MSPRQTEIIFALFGVGVGSLILGVWIPQDVDTGMIETFRRQTVIGDAFLPVIAGSAILLCSVLHLLQMLTHSASPSDAFAPETLTLSSLMLQGMFLIIITLSLLLMFWAGPALSILHEEGYRTLRGQFPFKYAGFFLGGTAMLTGCIALIEGRLRARIILIAALSTLFLIALFDLPFDSIILPPNGDW